VDVFRVGLLCVVSWDDLPVEVDLGDNAFLLGVSLGESLAGIVALVCSGLFLGVLFEVYTGCISGVVTFLLGRVLGGGTDTCEVRLVCLVDT